MSKLHDAEFSEILLRARKAPEFSHGLGPFATSEMHASESAFGGEAVVPQTSAEVRVPQESICPKGGPYLCAALPGGVAGAGFTTP